MDGEPASPANEVLRLREEMAALRAEIRQLRSETTTPRAAPQPDAAATAPPPVGARAPNERGGSPGHLLIRRTALMSLLAGVAGVLNACARPFRATAHAASTPHASAPAATLPLTLTAQGLQPLMNFQAPLDAMGNYPPLDSSVSWSRLHRQKSPGSTSELLSLIMEAEGDGAFPWPLYIQLVSRTTSTGEATGTYVRMFNEEGGWAAAYHTDLYHLGTGTSIGANIELTRTDSTANLPGGTYPPLPAQPAGRAIGLNIQNTTHSTAHGDQAINIQGGAGRSWHAAVNIEDQNVGTDGVAVGGQWENGVHLKGTGTTGLMIDGQYGSGITLAHNDIRLSSGSRIYLDDAADVYVQYNASNQTIEFVYRPKGVVASINIQQGTVSGVTGSHG